MVDAHLCSYQNSSDYKQFANEILQLNNLPPLKYPEQTVVQSKETLSSPIQTDEISNIQQNVICDTSDEERQPKDTSNRWQPKLSDRIIKYCLSTGKIKLSDNVPRMV